MSDEIPWPVTMVDELGNRVEVHSVLQAHEAAMTGGCRLERAVPGLNLAVAQQTRAKPRELAGRRDDTPPAAAVVDPAPGAPDAAPAPAPVEDQAPGQDDTTPVGDEQPVPEVVRTARARRNRAREA